VKFLLNIADKVWIFISTVYMVQKISLNTSISLECPSAHFEDALMFNPMNFTHMHADLNDRHVSVSTAVSKKKITAKFRANDGLVEKMYCACVPLNILGTTLTLKAGKELAFTDLYMPSKILLGGVRHCLHGMYESHWSLFQFLNNSL